MTNTGSGNVTKYAPPYTGAPVTTITSGLTDPTGIAFQRTSYAVSIAP